MTCEQCRAHMPEAINAGAIDEIGYDLHLDSCAACRAEAARLEALWLSLGDLPAPPAPSAGLRARFYESLSAYQQGLGESSRRRPFPPVWKFALTAAASLAIGFFAARSLDRTSLDRNSESTAQLRAEVAAMRQMVALSLLQQQSAGDRLKGVSWAYRIESPNAQPDAEVLSALLSTVNHDPSVNVRLAAVDALRAYAASPVARKALVQAIPKQDSPMVQIALIDQLAELGDLSAVPALTALSADAAVNHDVRQRAQWALGKIQ